MQLLAIGSSNLVEWFRMVDPANSHYVNLATCSFSLLDKNGATVAGCGNVAMPHVANSDGVYQGWIPATAPLVDGQNYTLVVTAVFGGGSYTGKRYIECKAQKRGPS
jgi:NAD/NADP transhydrogenase beta subunit